MSFTNIISGADLAGTLEHAVILDCRAKLGDPSWGQQAFLAGHIPGALYANLDVDLAAAPGLQGRHPLPTRDDWLQTVRNWGIQNHQQVIAYDDAGGAYAARAWWMLRWLGHAEVAVLDGGLASYSGSMETGITAPSGPSNFQQGNSLTKLITTEALSDIVQESQAASLVDARTKPRWAGIEEPIDPVAGHIPGAVCLPFQDNLDTDGKFKDSTTLAARFAQVDQSASQRDGAEAQPVICYCGSGVTATHNILALHIAGLPEPSLYADSWSGWITDPNRPISTSS